MNSINKENLERGAIIVEFAILLPFFLLLVIGMIEFGLLFYNQQVITNASREGARAGIARIAKDSDGNDFVLNESDIDDIIDNYCYERMITFAAVLPDPETSAPNLGGLPGDPLTVTTKVEYTFYFPGLLGFGTSIQLDAETTMDMELSL